MTLRLDADWVWDAWYLTEGDVVHAFFLHAPRSLGDPDLRHFRARVGHAVSRDLRTWERRPEALGPGHLGSFDDLATWTGSVIRDGTGWLMAYSGVSRAEAGTVQRIGFARSVDLEAWERTGPVIEADPRWYECGPSVRQTHWRDPWAWLAPDGTLHLLITARANHGPFDGRGVIAHAWSTDGGASFEVGPPLSEPGELFQLEVPQLVELGPDRWAVLASCRTVDHSAARRARPGFREETGTLTLEGSAPLGPFAVPPGPFLLGDPADRTYAGRLVELRGERLLMTWTDRVDGAFVGELADPLPLELGADGRLRVAPGPRA
jgi:beta-fructofuranosidase